MKTNMVYIVCCRDGTLYTGWTNDLEKRISAHNEGKGAKYTKCRRPVQLVYQRAFETKREAMREEARIKRLPRAQKLSLVQEAGAQAVWQPQEGSGHE